MRYFKHLIPLGRAIVIQYEPIHRLEQLASAQEKAETTGTPHLKSPDYTVRSGRAEPESNLPTV